MKENVKRPVTMISPKWIKGPDYEASANNAAVLAKILGGSVVPVGPRHMVFPYMSRKLPKLEGAAECRGLKVTLSLIDLSISEAGAMLAVLVLMRNKKKK